jgi:hypothetical protein
LAFIGAECAAHLKTAVLTLPQHRYSVLLSTTTNNIMALMMIEPYNADFYTVLPTEASFPQNLYQNVAFISSHCFWQHVHSICPPTLPENGVIFDKVSPRSPL